MRVMKKTMFRKNQGAASGEIGGPERGEGRGEKRAVKKGTM